VYHISVLYTINFDKKRPHTLMPRCAEKNVSFRNRLLINRESVPAHDLQRQLSSSLKPSSELFPSLLDGNDEQCSRKTPSWGDESHMTDVARLVVKFELRLLPRSAIPVFAWTAATSLDLQIPVQFPSRPSVRSERMLQTGKNDGKWSQTLIHDQSLPCESLKKH